MEVFYAQNTGAGVDWQQAGSRFRSPILVDKDSFKMVIDQKWYDRLNNLTFDKSYAPEKPVLVGLLPKPIKPTMPVFRSQPKPVSPEAVYNRFHINENSSKARKKKADAEIARLNARYEKSMAAYNNDKIRYEQLMETYNQKLDVYNTQLQRRNTQIDAFLVQVQAYQVTQFKYVYMKNLAMVAKSARKRFVNAPLMYAHTVKKIAVTISLRELNIDPGEDKTVSGYKSCYDYIAQFNAQYCKSQFQADYYELKDTVSQKLKSLYWPKTRHAGHTPVSSSEGHCPMQMPAYDTNSLDEFQNAVNIEYQEQYAVSPVGQRIKQQRNFNADVFRHNKQLRDSIEREKYLAYLQTPAGKQELERVGLDQYVAKITQLGWINCDRFNRETVTQYELAASESEQGVRMFVLFKKFDGMLSLIRKDETTYSCSKLPVGAQATLVCIKLDGGRVMYSAQPLIVQDKNMVFKPTYKTMSMDDLRVELEKLTSS
jgi:hypothetical protein